MRLTGAGCTSCGAAIPVDHIAVLADRGDLAFVELSCPACNSRTLGVVVGTATDADTAVLDTAAHPELGPESEARLAGRPPVDETDVLAMHLFLAGWEGDLRSLLDRSDDGAGRARA
jgi:hypothetical protein